MCNFYKKLCNNKLKLDQCHTRQHKGFEDIRTFLAEDKKTVYLYEKWDSKEDHQAYLDFRVKDGLMDFLKPRLDGDFKVTYFSEE